MNAPGQMWLTRSPFWLLGVSVRDPFGRIVEAATRPAHDAPADEIAQARLTLTNPRSRIAAEVSWLPGIAPARASEIVESLVHAAPSTAPVRLPRTATFNVLLSQLTRPQTNCSLEALDALIEAREAIDPAELVDEINQDRLAGAIPPIRDPGLVQDALDHATVRMAELVCDGLETLGAGSMAQILTQVALTRTDHGASPPSATLQALIEAFETRAQTYLLPEAVNIRELAAAVAKNGPKGASHLQPAVDLLATMLSNWAKVARPGQILARSQGKVHRTSRELGVDVRGSLIDLANDHSGFGPAFDMTHALSTAIDSADLGDTFAQDLAQLEKLRTEAQARALDDARMRYAATIGPLREHVSIDENTLTWQGAKHKLADIRAVRWGATRHSVNGIPTGTTYKVEVLGLSSALVCITTGGKNVFDNLTDRLWRTAGVRLMYEMLSKLRSGEKLQIGGVRFGDAWVTLSKSRFMKAEVKDFAWREVRIGAASGSFVITSSADPSFTARASYQNDFNTPVLANLLNFAFERGLLPLSKMLD